MDDNGLQCRILRSLARLVVMKVLELSISWVLELRMGGLSLVIGLGLRCVYSERK